MVVGELTRKFRTFYTVFKGQTEGSVSDVTLRMPKHINRHPCYITWMSLQRPIRFSISVLISLRINYVIFLHNVVSLRAIQISTTYCLT